MGRLFAPSAATVFLEIWKRQRARVVLHWDLYGWDEDQVRRRVIQGLSAHLVWRCRTCVCLVPGGCPRV